MAVVVAADVTRGGAAAVWQRLGGGGVSVTPAPQYLAALWPSRPWEPTPAIFLGAGFHCPSHCL